MDRPKRAIIVAGGRDFFDYPMLREAVWGLIRHLEADVEIVSGGARGADQLAEEFAREFRLENTVYAAQWNRKADGSYDRSAGYKRNEEMARNADALVAFWDGYSRGTKHMIDIALREGIEVHVYFYARSDGG